MHSERGRVHESRVFLSASAPDCEHEFLAAVARSEALHSPWVFSPRTHEQYAEYLQRAANGRTIPYWVRLRENRQLAGVINVGEPVMGVFQSGYWASTPLLDASTKAT